MIFNLPKTGLVMRDRQLLETLKGKKVLHIGFGDWPFTKDRFEKKELLHQKLHEVCDFLIGFDLDNASISFFKKKGYGEVYLQDIYKLSQRKEFIIKKRIEYILLGDVLEHLQNPGNALQEIHKAMNSKMKLIVTVPNFRNYFNLFYGLFNKELNHPEDHFFWPSYITMENLFKKNNFKIIDFKYSNYGDSFPSSFKGKLFYWIFMKPFKTFSQALYFTVIKA